MTTDLQSQLHRLRIVLSLRFTLVCIASLVAAALAGLSMGILTLVPAITLVLFLKDENVSTGLALLAGLFFGAAIVLLTSYFWAQEPLVFLVIIMVHVFAMAYWAAQGIRGRWGYIGFPIAAEFCLLSAAFAQISDTAGAVDAIQIWVEELPLGVVVLWIMLVAIWPAPSARDIDRLVEAVRRECAPLLRGAIDPVARGIPTVTVASPISLTFFGELTRLVSLNAGRLRSAEHDSDFLIAKLEVLSQMYANIRYIQRAFEDLPEPGLSVEARNAAAEIMAAQSDGIAGRPVADIAAAREVIRREEQNYAARGGDELTARRLAARLAGFSVASEALADDIDTLDHPDTLQSAVTVAKPIKETAPNLMLDSLQSAIKIVIGVLVGILVFMVTDLPASGYLIMIILIVLVQPNLGRAFLRFRLWFPGVLIGSLWAIAGLMVLSLLPHFGVYLAWLLPGFFLAGYISSGPDRYSYIGIQIAAGMATIFGMAVYPANNVVSADMRVVGAVVGFMIALMVGTMIWPAHPAKLLRKNLVHNLREMMATLSSTCRIADSGRIEEKDALARRLASQKLLIQADFGLLNDISYMLTRRIRPAYDYAALTRSVGRMYQQVWCLFQSLSAVEDSDRRRKIVAPIAATEEALTAIFEGLADRMDRGEGITAQDVAQQIATMRAQLHRFFDALAVETDPRNREDMEYGVNAVSVIVYHLNVLAEAMDTEPTSHQFQTAQPAQLQGSANR